MDTLCIAQLDEAVDHADAVLGSLATRVADAGNKRICQTPHQR